MILQITCHIVIAMCQRENVSNGSMPTIRSVVEQTLVGLFSNNALNKEQNSTFTLANVYGRRDITRPSNIVSQSPNSSGMAGTHSNSVPVMNTARHVIVI